MILENESFQENKKNLEKISIAQVLWNFLKENKKSVFGYLFFSLAVPISNIYLPHLYGQIISVISENKAINREVKKRFFMIFILWCLVQFFWAAMNVIDSKFIPRLRSHVRVYIVEKVLDAYRENYEEEELGGIIAEIVRLPDEVDHMFGNIRNHILPMSFMLISSIAYFTWTNPRLGAASVAAIGMYLGIAIHFSRYCIPTWDQMNASHQVLHGEINDSLGNLLNIYSANQDQAELSRLDYYEQKFLQHHRKTIRCAGNFRLSLNLSYIIMFCSINVLSFYLFSKGILPLNNVVSVLIISLELISKMAGFIGSVDRIMYEISTIQQVQKILDNLSDRSLQGETGENILDATLEGDLKFQNVDLAYDGNKVLDNVTLHFPKGTTTVLVGEIGSGKTSLLNSLVRLAPYNGNIFIDGIDIRNLKLETLRNQVLYVPQNQKLFNRSIYENISYGNNVDKSTAKKTLEHYGLQIDLDRNVGKFGQSLSGGQRQIVYLLRCLFKNAPIVLLDEPTSNLDSETKQFILNILRDLLRNRTVIIITHDSEVLRYADNVVTMDKGKVTS